MDQSQNLIRRNH